VLKKQQVYAIFGTETDTVITVFW